MRNGADTGRLAVTITNGGWEQAKQTGVTALMLGAAALTIAAVLGFLFAVPVQWSTQWVAGFRPSFQVASKAAGVAFLAPAAVTAAIAEFPSLRAAIIVVPLLLLCYPIAGYALGRSIFPTPSDREARIADSDYRDIGTAKGFVIALIVAGQGCGCIFAG